MDIALQAPGSACAVAAQATTLANSTQRRRTAPRGRGTLFMAKRLDPRRRASIGSICAALRPAVSRPARGDDDTSPEVPAQADRIERTLLLAGLRAERDEVHGAMCSSAQTPGLRLWTLGPSRFTLSCTSVQMSAQFLEQFR